LGTGDLPGLPNHRQGGWLSRPLPAGTFRIKRHAGASAWPMLAV